MKCLHHWPLQNPSLLLLTLLDCPHAAVLLLALTQSCPPSFCFQLNPQSPCTCPQPWWALLNVSRGRTGVSEHSQYCLSFLFALRPTALAMFHQLMAPSFLDPMPTLTCLGGPTFIVLNFTSNP